MFGLAPPWWGSGNTTLTSPGWDSATKSTSGSAAITLTDSNRLATYVAASFSNGWVKAYRPRNAGKYYWEVIVTNVSSFAYGYMGWTSIANGTTGSPMGNGYSWRMLVSTGSILFLRSGGGTYTASIGAIANGATIMCALDIDADKVWLGVNGTWYNSGNPAAGTNPTLSKAVTGADMNITSGRPFVEFAETGTCTAAMRGAVSDVNYSVPSGFKAWYDPDDTAYDA